MSDLITVERRGTTALLTLCRPPANALNLALFRELHSLLPSLSSPTVRALVLTGQGRFFSAGLDLFEVFRYSESDAETFSRLFDEVLTSLFALDLPVIAAINGHAIAGGAVLAAAADFRLISDGEAQIGLSEIRVGVPFPTSALEIVRCAWSGPHLASMLFRGRSCQPAQALANLLVDKVVPATKLLEQALALADELGARVPLAFSTTKRALRREALERMAKAREGGQDPVWTLWRSPEILAAVRAYGEALENRKA